MASFFNSLNTHFAGLAGVVLGVAGSVVEFVSQPQVAGVITTVVPERARPLAGGILSLAGLALAYFGRPKTLAPSDAVQVARAEAKSEPHPITPAKPDAPGTTPAAPIVASDPPGTSAPEIPISSADGPVKTL